jgi:hypothetical protein
LLRGPPGTVQSKNKFSHNHPGGAMSTTITNQPSTESPGRSSQATNQTSDPRPVHRRRRVLLSVVVAAALGFGAGAAVVAVTDSDGTSRQAHSAPAPSPKVDVQALWNALSTLPVSHEANVVVGLAPSVRAQLQAVAEGYAVAAEHH